MVPPAQVRSYYGRPILKEPAWKVPDVPLYLFLGGMAGSSASMAALADLTGRRELARIGRYLAAGGAMASLVALVHDLGRPARFLNMLRVVKPTSPLSVGTWILGPFSALATAAAASEASRLAPGAGRLAGAGAALLGPAMCTYTSVLLADTAVPAWHEAYPQLPFLFAGSALASGAGAALVAVRDLPAPPVVRMAVIGAAVELGAARQIERSHELVAEPYLIGRPARLLRAGRALTALGAGLAVLGRRSRTASIAAGVSLLAAGLLTRFGIFDAGVESTRDPKYVVVPQRQRLRQLSASQDHSAEMPDHLPIRERSDH